jgi:hypothetical protein
MSIVIIDPKHYDPETEVHFIHTSESGVVSNLVFTLEDVVELSGLMVMLRADRQGQVS